MQFFSMFTILTNTAILVLVSSHALANPQEANPKGVDPKGVDSKETNQEIPNLRAYSSTFASSGQPTAEQLQQLENDGYERIIYIAFSDHKQSLLQEDRVVKDLGMDYLQIPVNWTTPTASDFALFAGAMQLAPTKKTLLHCQMNYRASAFALLYRVIYLQVPLAQAMADMQSVWTPTEHWVAFMQQTLKAHGKPTACTGCEWQPAANR